MTCSLVIHQKADLHENKIALITLKIFLIDFISKLMLKNSKDANRIIYQKEKKMINEASMRIKQPLQSNLCELQAASVIGSLRNSVKWKQLYPRPIIPVDWHETGNPFVSILETT